MIAPNSALCQVLSPPTQTQDQNEPVSQARNTTVSVINTATTKVIAQANPDAPGSGATEGGSPASGDSSTDKASDTKLTASGVAASSDKPGTKSDVAKKLYCN